MEMSLNEQASWAGHLQTPVIFNHHEPLEINHTSIIHVDLNPIKSTRKAVTNEERVLILTPLKDAAPYLSKYFELIAELTYPHHLIDLAFLVGDSKDDTLAVLASELDRIQGRPDKIPFNSAMVVEKDFGFELSQSVEERHSFKAQGPRRKAMGKARNYLLSAAMKPEHSWVYWRDVDIVDSPKKILEDFIAHDTDILVPSKYIFRMATTWKLLTIWKTFGFTATAMAVTSRVALTTTLGSSLIRVVDCQPAWTRTSFSPKVRDAAPSTRKWMLTTSD